MRPAILRGIAGLLACSATMAIASPAHGATVTVTGTADTEFVDGTCTLREAISSTDADVQTTLDCPPVGTFGDDTINFAASFDRGDADEITLTSNMEAIDDNDGTTIDACSSNPGPGPCAGITGTGAIRTAFDVNANDVSVSGFAFNELVTPVHVHDDRTGFTVTNSVFGEQIGPTFDADGFDTVVIEGDSAVIGGSDAGDRNYFPSTNDGSKPSLLIRGNTNQVLGNVFGFFPGDTPVTGTRSEDHVEVSGNSSFAPTGTFVGGNVGAAGAATTVCDNACNVISNAGEHGVDLDGETAQGEDPSAQTTVVGNFIGLDPAGDSGAGNGGNGVNVGDADFTAIGGPAAGQRNFIGDNGSAGVANTASSGQLFVRNSFIGLNSAGTGAIPDATRAIDASGPAVIFDNRFGGTATAPTGGGVVLSGTAATATVVTNVFGIGVGGQDVGLPVSAVSTSPGRNAGIGEASVNTGNVFGNMRGAGSTALQLDSDENVVLGNLFGTDGSVAHPNDGVAITIGGGVPLPDSNRIGGLTAASENVISNSAQGGIEIIGDGSDLNEVLRNRGSGNGGLFLDVGDDGVGNDAASGPNEGIQAPEITSADEAAVSGTGEVGATVAVYTTSNGGGAAPTGLIAFAGATEVDGSGQWTLICPSAECSSQLPDTAQVTANQTDDADSDPNTPGNSSEFADAFAYAAPAPPGGGDPEPQPGDSIAPSVTITDGPKQKTKKKNATFEFTGTDARAVARFECSLDGAGFTPCTSPHSVKVKKGNHTFEVRAVDDSGNVGSPASADWKLKKKKRKKK